MSVEALFAGAQQRIETQYGITVMLRNARAGKVFPEVDVLNRQIFFNPRIKAFITLYNPILLYSKSGSEAISLFTLYNLYLDVGFYTQAAAALNLLEREVNRLHRSLCWKSRRPLIQSVNMQVLFILLHEAAHIIFHFNSDMRADYVNRARQRVENMRIETTGLPKRVKGYMESLIPRELPEEIRRVAVKGQYEKMEKYADRIFNFNCYLNPDDDSMLEEFSCDEMAWNRNIVQLMETTLSDEIVLEGNIDILMALYILDYDRCLKFVYTDSCEEKMPEFPRVAGIRHASLRECISHFYKETFPSDYSLAFLRQSEELDERSKHLLMSSMFDHITDISVLKDETWRVPDLKRIKELEMHFAEIEQRILAFLRS